MITILTLLIFLMFVSFFLEEKLLKILMTMEMITMFSFFLILMLNTELMCFSSCVISLLSIQISESVLSLGIFVSLIRTAGFEKVSSLMTSKL